MEYNTIPLVRNEEKKRFEIEVDGHYAFIDYKESRNKIALIHTETDPELAGKGAASAVVEKTLHYLDDNNITLLPFCPYVFAYIKKHPEWKRIISPDFKGYDEL
ncbi:GNAT family N-acetyltransferase [Xanthomarina sp. F1114]|uniref:GNAT family N-acetyltransferase n=1 Tax=Xanthomarina sp. F1114 TaxID=2996019 RepID=UPI00225E0666|nr:GNAT family N-acetyltransferase [Xanthomarina sp. F1114]MCX7548951.1 GNAT family N-acetyltransferase [Xanthomarina sp. F1114]